MTAEFHKVTHANDNKGLLTKEDDPRVLLVAKRDRRLANSVKQYIMESAMKNSSAVLAGTASRLSSPQAGISQLDGADSPTRHRGREKDKKRHSRPKEDTKEEDTGKQRRKEKNVYEPLHVSDKRFVRFVQTVVDAVSEEVELKVSKGDPRFDPKDVMHVSRSVGFGVNVFRMQIRYVGSLL